MTTIESRRAQPLRVLLVVDSPDDAEMFRRELVEQGFLPEIEHVQSGGELERALDQKRCWDVVLCDHVLPCFDCLSALSIVKSRGIELPFIIVSSTIPEAAAINAMRLGAHDCLLKSGLARLGVVIERELRESATRIERARMRELLLSDRMVSIGTLASGVAHEINNPLSYVIGNIDFSLQRLTMLRAAGILDKESFEGLEHTLKQAREGSDRIRQTTRDLRVLAGNDESPPAPIDVTRVMNSSINLAWNQIRHRARVVREFATVPSVLGNEARLGRVFLNLLVNAAQALREPDVGRHEIKVAICAEGERVAVRISDTGGGIAPDVLVRLFEPFFTTTPKGGMALGLAICHSIITAAGGQITVTSELGVGTEFKVTLPTTDAAELHSTPAIANPPAHNRLRLMVIDDEPNLLTLVRRMLIEHEVVGFRDAREALKVLQGGERFDLIFCDLMMPAMSGADFHAALAHALPELVARVVFLTGGAFGGSARLFLGAVPNVLITKPFDVIALRSAISRVLADGLGAISVTAR